MAYNIAEVGGLLKERDDLKAEIARLKADKAEAFKWLSWIDLKDTRNARKYINEAMHYLKGGDDGNE